MLLYRAQYTALANVASPTRKRASMLVNSSVEAIAETAQSRLGETNARAESGHRCV